WEAAVPPSTASGTKRPGQHIVYSRSPPEILYSGGDSPKTASPDWMPVFHKQLSINKLPK
ncbi:MAG: hypothetical protein J6W01_01610, partial [Bacteroidales bacterium]|nr:hypothetical protein [Bacteroidales bacterium]